jgi:hypothetical protein
LRQLWGGFFLPKRGGGKMKTTFYCVKAEFYNNGGVKACAAEKQANKKPDNQFRQVYGMAAFFIWTPNKEFAEKLLEMVNGGEVYVDDLIAFYEECLPLEGRAA